MSSIHSNIVLFCLGKHVNAHFFKTSHLTHLRQYACAVVALKSELFRVNHHHRKSVQKKVSLLLICCSTICGTFVDIKADRVRDADTRMRGLSFCGVLTRDFRFWFISSAVVRSGSRFVAVFSLLLSQLTVQRSVYALASQRRPRGQKEALQEALQPPLTERNRWPKKEQFWSELVSDRKQAGRGQSLDPSSADTSLSNLWF